MTRTSLFVSILSLSLIGAQQARADEEPGHTTTVDHPNAIWIAGATATAVGGASFIAGIPMLAAGTRRGHEEARRSPLTWVPNLAVGKQGAVASSSFRF